MTGSSRVIHGDCVAAMKDIPEDYFHSVVTDPPYELGFMGKSWDSSGIAFQSGTWAQVLRVLKPGGYLLAFGGTRTYHRIACAIEDAGFEIRDSIHWIYGSGFPKAFDVSKAIDRIKGAERKVIGTQERYNEPSGIVKAGQGDRTLINREISRAGSPEGQRYEGWAPALKPACEPVVVARKPFKGSLAQNILDHGTGAFNIRGCKVGDEVRVNQRGATTPRVAMGDGWREDADPQLTVGRWPPNVLFGEGAAPEDADFFPVFRYQAKAPRSERPKVDGIAHATVKPLELMRWLVRLVTPEGGIVLDPFGGSGTTGEACQKEGFRYVLIELDEDHYRLISKRLEQPTLFEEVLFEGLSVLRALPY